MEGEKRTFFTFHFNMLLIHDLGEIYVGDTWIFDESNKDEIYRKELNAFKQLISPLPPDQRAELLSLFIEFGDQESREARFAKVLDAVQPLINHLYVAEKNENPDRIKVSMVLEKKAFIKDYAARLWSLVEETISKSVKKGLYKM